ncbi:anti-sigma-factor [Methyloversatilis sp.]|uniref:STAS domain-containing protein n=1 Tax=Methyloversatilis sp. TaxID=2569862 RepID=UPI0027B99A13|nr:anti-sigma-factor [Methyloversatilis sp.]
MAFSFFKKSPAPQVETRKPVQPARGGTTSRPPQSTPPPSAPLSVSPSVSPSGGLISLDFISRDPLEGARRMGKGELEVQDVSSGLHPVVEEAAMLFANGEDEAALSALERATFDDLGSSAEQVWSMLFDLCHALGRCDAFEAHALAYAERFERSAPTWPASPSRSAANGPPTLTLSGKLSEASRAMIDQFDRLACKTPLLRLDTARVQDVDEEGARMLTEALVKVRRSGHRVAMINATHLRDLLAPRVIPGTAALPEQWLLYLETLQQLGDEAAFEEFAIQYAVTFEQSPPSWDARWVSATLLPCAPEPAKPIGKQAVALQGEITGARQDAFAVLTAGDHPPGVLKVECCDLKRMDFISAGLLFNVITAVQATGRQPRFVEVRPMIAALFVLIGVAAVAEIQQRHF